MRAIPPDLSSHCDRVRRELEDAYLQHPDTQPWRQSGMSGPIDRWTSLRKPIADCIDHDGCFLDLCCANGFLLECVLSWTRERDIAITPYGLDISPKFIALAQARLPAYRENLFVGNSFVWEPPRKMDYVSTMAGLFPRQYEEQFVEFVVQRHLKDDGQLLIHQTGSQGDAERNLRSTLALERFHQVGYRVGHDPVKNKEVYVTILMK